MTDFVGAKSSIEIIATIQITENQTSLQSSPARLAWVFKRAYARPQLDHALWHCEKLWR